MENNTNTYCVLRMKDLPKKIGFQPSTIYELIAKGKVSEDIALEEQDIQ